MIPWPRIAAPDPTPPSEDELHEVTATLAAELGLPAGAASTMRAGMIAVDRVLRGER